MNTRGQVLIPGLAIYLGLWLVFFWWIVYGVRVLSQMHLDMAAQSAALSAARAEAELLNHCAGHNLMANFFVNARYKGYGAMQGSMVNSFELWLYSESAQKNLGWLQNLLNGFKGFPAAVGSRVAKLNGSTSPAVYFPRPMYLQVDLHELKVFLLHGAIPIPVPPITFKGVYYTRQWGPSERHPQPPHQTTWLVKRGDRFALATAGVYLDERDNTPLNNGGFPRPPEDESFLGNFEFQSFYPQFNARLIKTVLSPSFTEAWHQLHGG